MQTQFEINQRNSYKLQFNLVDEYEDAIQLSDIDAMYLTQYYLNPDSISYLNGKRKSSDKYDLQIVNSREDQNVLNTNQVSVSASGTVQWDILPADTAKLNGVTETEYHVALFTWTYASTKQNSVEFFFKVRKIPFAIT